MGKWRLLASMVPSKWRRFYLLLFFFSIFSISLYVVASENVVPLCIFFFQVEDLWFMASLPEDRMCRTVDGFAKFVSR